MSDHIIDAALHAIEARLLNGYLNDLWFVLISPEHEPLRFTDEAEARCVAAVWRARGYDSVVQKYTPRSHFARGGFSRQAPAGLRYKRTSP